MWPVLVPVPPSLFTSVPLLDPTTAQSSWTHLFFVVWHTGCSRAHRFARLKFVTLFSALLRGVSVVWRHFGSVASGCLVWCAGCTRRLLIRRYGLWRTGFLGSREYERRWGGLTLEVMSVQNWFWRASSCCCRRSYSKARFWFVLISDFSCEIS